MSNKLLLTTPSDQFQCTIDNRPNNTILAKCDICYSSPCQNNGICKRKIISSPNSPPSSTYYQTGNLLNSNQLINKWSIDNQKAKLDQRMKYDDDDGLIEHLDQSPLESSNLPLASKLYKSRYSSDSLDPMDTLMSDDANIDLTSNLNNFNSLLNSANNQIVIVNASEFFSYTCDCLPSYFGQNCEQKIDACFGNPCANNGKCELMEDENNFVCLCLSGFTGSVCETNIDDCLNNQCKNSAKCIDGINDYTCECQSGFTGKYCEQKIEYCSKLNPCQNEATCVPINQLNIISDYQCNCKLGWTGRNCSENIDDCK